MTSYIIHHSADNDGLCSGYIANLANPYSSIIGYDYPDTTDWIDTIPSGSSVTMLDISLPFEKMVALSNRVSMTWIDHHQTAHEKLSPHLPNTHIVFGKASACRLAWKHFFPDTLEPKWVELTGKYDLFDKSSVSYWENLVLPFEHGVRALNIQNAKGFGIVQKHNHETLIDRGKVIVAYEQARINKIAHESAITTFEGLKAMVIPSETSDFWYKTPQYLREKPDIMLFVRRVFKTNSWKISVHQGANTPINCEAIAVRYGGGGHYNGGGFSSKELPF